MYKLNYAQAQALFIIWHLFNFSPILMVHGHSVNLNMDTRVLCYLSFVNELRTGVSVTNKVQFYNWAF